VDVKVGDVLAQELEDFLIPQRDVDREDRAVLELAFDPVVDEPRLRDLLGLRVLLGDAVQLAVGDLPMQLVRIEGEHAHQRERPDAHQEQHEDAGPLGW